MLYTCELMILNLKIDFSGFAKVWITYLNNRYRIINRKRQQLITKIIVDFLKQYCSQILIAKRRAVLWQDPLIPKVKSMHLWLTGLPQT